MNIHYKKSFYKEMEDSNLKSARRIVPFVLNMVDIKSVVDFGCGVGLWLKAFREKGVQNITGIDGNWVKKDMLEIPVNDFITANFEELLKFDKKADLAVCLEVAEHISEKKSDNLIKNLVNTAPVIMFSAAIPLQGGSRHINEQWPDYWQEKFAKFNYVPVDCVRRHFWDDNDVSFFYSQNIILYVKKDKLDSFEKLAKEYKSGNNKAIRLVHPHMYLYYSERWRMLVPYLGKIPPSILHKIKKILKSIKRKR